MDEVRSSPSWRTPVGMTLLGIGALPAHHPLNLGMMGMHGEHWVNEADQEADLMLAFGMRFDDRVTGKLALYAPHGKKIHIDIDPAELHKNVRADVAIAGDLKTVLQAPSCPSSSGARHDALARAHRGAGRRATVRDIAELPDNGRPLRRARDPRHLEGHRRRAIVVTDVGQHQMWAAQFTARASRAPGSPPAAWARWASASRPRSARQLARPDREVWAIVGDGGFQMTLSELQTIVQQNRQGQHRDHQQRLPGHGAAVAGVLPPPPLLRDADVVAGLT